MRTIRSATMLLLVATWFGAAALAQAQQQQQWAAAYVDWTLPEGTQGRGLAQDLWAPQAGRASFFTLNFDFVTGEGGYIGLQSDENGEGNVRFSLWNATVARGDSCRPFDGEGEGMTCVLPVAIDPAAVYRVRVTREETAAEGQWWVGWLDTPDGTQHRIGAIRTQRRHQEFLGASLHNFSEFWGDAVTACRDAPLSAAVFGAPVLMLGDGRQVAGADPNGTRPEENRCATGRERLGAAVTQIPMSLRGAPAMAVTLGGAPAANWALAQNVSASVPTR